MSSDPLNLMILGTGSGVGKSVITVGLGRLLRRRGYDVAPFKAQNMSNNAGVAVEGGEIGRSQMNQARACGQSPSVHMNPILLKPLGDNRSEVLVQGEPEATLTWKEYRRNQERFRRRVLESYDHLADRHDVIIIEGAGSALEPNLRDQDLVNLPLADWIDAPVFLVTDIRRGGAFAWLTGTMELMDNSEADRVRGYLINRFQGDRSSLDEPESYLPEEYRKPVLGMLPYEPDLALPQEDSLGAGALERAADTEDPIRVGFVRFPHLSNYDEFQLLAAHPAVDSRLIEQPNGFDPDLIVLPGTRNTMEDLTWLQTSGLSEWFRERRDRGTRFLGVCGGYQMMGRSVHDPESIESSRERVEGLGWFKSRCRFRQPKLSVSGTYELDVPRTSNPVELPGYQIRYGRIEGTTGSGWVRPTNGEQPTGLGQATTNVLGTAVHGLFERTDGVRELLRWVRPGDSPGVPDPIEPIDRWADTMEQYVDVDRLLGLAREWNS